MPELEYGRHERFARCVAQGVNAIKCYTSSGYPPDPAAAVQLEKAPVIFERIRELEYEQASK